MFFFLPSILLGHVQNNKKEGLLLLKLTNPILPNNTIQKPAFEFFLKILMD